MAEVSETLEYRFEESGLDDLRRDMGRLAEDVEEVGDEFSELGGETEAGTEAAEEAVEDLQRRVNRLDFSEIGDEAMDAADEVALAASLMKDKIEEVQDALDGISTLGARRQMRRLGQEVENVMLRAQALDGQDVNINPDVDQDRSLAGGGGRDGVRVPNELKEAQRGFLFAVRGIPPQLQALGAAAVAATAALGAGAGLAGVATALAAKLGPQGLQSEVKAVQSTFKQTGREFASAFSSVIRGEVIPAAKGLALAIRGADEALASFSATAITLLKNIPGGLAPVGGAIKGLQAGGAASENLTNADALAQGIGDVKGIRGILTTMNQSIASVRERFRKGLIPKEEMLSQIKSFRMEAFKSLQKLKQKIPGAFPPDLLDSFASKLRQVKQQLQSIKNLVPVGEQLASIQRIHAATGDTAPLESNVQKRGPLTPGPGVTPFALAGSPAELGPRIFAKAFKKARKEAEKTKKVTKDIATTLMKAGFQSLRRITSGFGRALGGALFADQRRVNRLEARRRRIQQNLRQARDAGNFEQVKQLKKDLAKVNEKLRQTKSLFGRIGQAFQNFGRIAKQVLERVISKLLSAALLATILSAITGGTSLSVAGLSGFSSFGKFFKKGLTGFAEGGIVTGPTAALIGEGSESEAVMPLSKLEAMIQPSMPSAQPATTGGMTIAVEIQGESRIENGHIKKAYDTAAQVEQQVGRKSR